MDKKEIKNNNFGCLILVIWWIGFCFTVGIMATEATAHDTVSFVYQILMCLFWPLALGVYFAKLLGTY